MTREEKIIKRKKRVENRRIKNKKRNENRWQRSGRGTGRDCPFDVEMNNMYGTCHCNGENYTDCLGDI